MRKLSGRSGVLKNLFIEMGALYCDSLSSHARPAQAGMSEITQGNGRCNFTVYWSPVMSILGGSGCGANRTDRENGTTSAG